MSQPHALRCKNSKYVLTPTVLSFQLKLRMLTKWSVPRTGFRHLGPTLNSEHTSEVVGRCLRRPVRSELSCLCCCDRTIVLRLRSHSEHTIVLRRLDGRTKQELLQCLRVIKCKTPLTLYSAFESFRLTLRFSLSGVLLLVLPLLSLYQPVGARFDRWISRINFLLPYPSKAITVQ